MAEVTANIGVDVLTAVVRQLSEFSQNHRNQHQHQVLERDRIIDRFEQSPHRASVCDDDLEVFTSMSAE
jgi:hypothetical protein